MSIDAEQRYAALAAAFSGDEGVGYDPPVAGRRAFGTGALKAGGKIFAMLSHDRLVVKLPRTRVDALVASGEGVRFDPGHGRVMREWLSLEPSSELDWLVLAREARGFVASKR